MLEQSTLYTLGFVIIVIIALQYISFMVLRKFVKNEIGKVARVLLRNKTNISNISNNNQVINREKQENRDESVDVDTPTNVENEDIDSYVNPVPSVDQDD